MARPHRRPGKSSRQQQVPNYAALESRQLLAAFTGTAGNDVVTIQFTGGVPTSIEINGTPLNNPDPTLSIDLGGGQDTLNLRGAAFIVNGTSGIPAGNPSGNAFDGAGTVNGVVTYSFGGKLTITTGDGADIFNINSAAGFVPSTQQGYRSYNLDGGAGADTFNLSGGFGFVRGGLGNDIYNSLDGHPIAEISDTGGFDEWRTSSTNGSWVVDDVVAGEFRLRRQVVGGGKMSGIERLVAASPLSASVFNRFSRDAQDNSAAPLGLFFSHYDNQTVVLHTASGTSIELENYNNFGGGVRPDGSFIFENAVNVQATAYEIRAGELNQLVIGGNVNAGDTSLVNHRITPRNIRQYIVTNSGNVNPQQVLYNREGSSNSFRLSGLTTVPLSGIHVINFPDSTRLAPEVTILGSKTAPTFFYVGGSLGRVTLIGGQAADRFIIGMVNGQANRNLDLMRGQVNVIGGGGDDYLRADDRDASGRFSYTLKDNWIFNAPDPAGDADRPFAGIWFSGVKRVEIQGTAQENRFRVTPSFFTRFSVYGGAPTTGLGDRLLLVGDVPNPRQFISLGPRKGTWYFGDATGDENFRKTVYIEDIETNVGYGV